MIQTSSQLLLGHDFASTEETWSVATVQSGKTLVKYFQSA